ALGLHALLVEGGEGRVEVVDLDRDVAVAGADLVRLGAVVVVRQLEPGLGIARVGEEMIRGLVADRGGAHVLEAQALRVELDRGGGVEDPVTGVCEGSIHALQSTSRMRPAATTRARSPRSSRRRLP